MKNPVKVTIITLAVLVVLAVAGIVIAIVNQQPEADAETVASSQLLRDDTHLLDDAGPDAVTVVEFFDFECPPCGAFAPIVAELRQKYAGDVTFAVRYFPLPSHSNAVPAALAAEAAAAQGQFEPMFEKLFAMQPEWAGADAETPEVFRGYAEELGLDMAAYDAAVADPATLERVLADFDEGKALGITSTPTFFVDGEYAPMQRYSDLQDAIDKALAAR